MGVEIERKFLVTGTAWRAAGGQPTLLRQGYLSTDPERTVRVRIEGEAATLTIKGRNRGATRGEWEYPIPVPEAAELLDTLCHQPLVEKIRHRINVASRRFWHSFAKFLAPGKILFSSEICRIFSTSRSEC